MKISLLLMVLALFVLSGCGGGGSGSAQLEVSRGFATGNASFDGGLYIQGKSTSGQEFSFSLATTQTASVVLPFGVWELKAVAWDHDSGPGKILEGDTHCAYAKVDFKADNQTIKLQATKANCLNEHFSSTVLDGASYAFFEDTGTGTYSPKTLNVNFCGALYDPSNPSVLRAASGLEGSFCDAYPKAFHEKPSSMLVTLFNKTLDGPSTKGLSSGCISGIDVGLTFSTGLRIPTRIPIAIDVFDSPDCTGSIAGSYEFPAGIDNSRSRGEAGFDSLMHPSSSGTVLALASPYSRRGTSGFLTEMPGFRCNNSTSSDPGEACIFLPSLPASTQFMLEQGFNRIRFPSDTCQSFDNTADTNITRVNCYVTNEGDAILELNVAFAAPDGATSFKFGGVTQNVYIRQGFNNLMREMKRLLGWVNDNSMNDSLAEHYDEDQEDGYDLDGEIGNIQEMLSPWILGGLFWDQQCSTSPMAGPITRTISFFEDGFQENYALIMTNPPAQNGPNFYSDSSNPRNLTASNPYNRRFIVRRFDNAVSGYKTETILDIACDDDTLFNTSSNRRIGRIEEIFVENDSNYTHEERFLMFWNTSRHNNARFEIYRYQSNVDNTTGNIWESTSFERGEKYGGSMNRDFKITKLNYQYHQDLKTAASSDDEARENLTHSEIEVSATTLTNMQLESIQLSRSGGVFPAESIFTHKFFEAEKQKVKYGTYNQNAAPSPTVNEFKVDANGKFIRAFADGANLHIERFDGSSYSLHTSSPITFGGKLVDVDMSFDSNYQIVAAANGSTVYLYLWNGSGWTSSSFAASTTIEQMEVGILDSGKILVLMKTASTVEVKAGTAASLPTTAAENLQGTTYAVYPSETIRDVGLAKLATDKFIIGMTVHYFDAANYFSRVASCEFVASTSCTVPNPTVYEVQSTSDTNHAVDLSVTNNADGTKVIVSFSNSTTSSPTDTSRTEFFVYSSSDGLTSWNQDSNLQASAGYSVKRHYPWHDVYDLSNITLVPSPVRVKPPYVNPAVPGFKMNLNNLRPSHMINNVFTDRATFENIQN